METKEQEAKEAWRNLAQKLRWQYGYDVVSGKDAKKDWSMDLLSDFQTALIEALNEEIDNVNKMHALAYYKEARIEGLKQAISLVKTVTPKKK